MIPTDASTESSTVFHIPGMDCPSEEQLIRMALASLEINALFFDLNQKKLTVRHRIRPEDILSKLQPLGLGAVMSSSEQVPVSAESPADEASQTRVLIWLLTLNGAMFFIEVTAGWLAHSAGLIADGIDMFSDAAVYGVSLFVVGKAAAYKLKAAKLAGLIQIALAAGIFGRVAYQISSDVMPEADSMIGFSFLALVVNIVCLYLVSKHRNDGVHMRASYIFSANDVITSLGVIIAGFLVAWLSSPYPDWIIGIIIGLVVLLGGIRILRL
ncbi:cation transporter [Zwartia vadi]|uniref:cation transporter n=1 Tax=Zwartia vadi TaxID=3058168 RepID=UPI0025B47B7F|nr:cation transporter [Zwartia vadi]MDN3987282.1 cation transporter [Zwartia vadi]